MDDEKLKSLFSNFDPDLSSDFQFMNSLQRSLNSVEIIKRHTAEVRARNRKAVAIAAFVGFIVGFLCSLAVPYLTEAVSHWQLTLPQDSILNTFATNFPIIAWLIIGGASVSVAINSYDLSLSLMKPQENSTHYFNLDNS